MVLVIESSDPDAINAILAVAKALKVTFRIEPDAETVSQMAQEQRMEYLEKFKGG